MSLLDEAVLNLCKYYYIKVNIKKVRKWIRKQGNPSINEVISKFFKDPHTYYDNTNEDEFMKIAPKPKAEFTESVHTIILVMGPFIGCFREKYEVNYARICQKAIKRVHKTGKEFLIDLRKNGGGDDQIMRNALAGIEDLLPGMIVVSKDTASAAEMITADLVYDHGWTKIGPRTSGALSQCKNIILSDGSFLGITIGGYTTRGGYKCNKFYL